MYTLTLNNSETQGKFSEITKKLEEANARVISCQNHGLQYLIVCRSTGKEIGKMHYADKENDPIRRSSLRSETYNRKN